MHQRRLACLALAGTLVLSACADDPTQPSAANVDPSLSTLPGEEPGTQLVVFATRSIPADFAARVASLGGTVEQALAPIGVAFVSGLDDSGKQALSADAAISFVEAERVLPLVEPVATDMLADAQPLAEEPLADQPMSPTEPGKATYHYLQWHLRQIGAPKAWAAGKLGSPSVTVGIIDTGLDYTHRDLAGLVDLGRSRSFLPTEDAVVARYLPAGTHPMFDLQGHGTHVGSTVASNGIIAAGVTSRVKLVGLKVCRSGIAGLTAAGCPASATFAALMYAADNGIDVVNMSLGGLFTKSTAGGYEETVNRVFEYAKERKLTVVVSAGNDNVDLDHNFVPVTSPTGGTTQERYPSLYATYCNSPHTICVSATGPASATNSQSGPWFDIDAKAGYSNFGRSAISVAGPGGTGSGFVWAACPTRRVVRTSAAGVTPATYAGRTDSYCVSFPTGKSGTSMAAPHVTALAALMVEKYGKSPERVSNAIRKSSDDLGQRGTDPIYGAGRINVANALGL
jgi:subtilisin family serine protease